VRTRTRADAGRSQRDELEQLQQELREARRQRGALTRENAGLSAQVERLEQEVRWLRRMVEVARAEAGRPASSLPEQLILPFRATPSRRTAYGRMRFALKLLPSSLAMLLYLWGPMIGSLQRFAAYGGIIFFCLVLLYFLQGPEDDDEAQAWAFDEEGLAPQGSRAPQGQIFYREIQSVEVRQGWLQRLFGFGSVRITWSPGVPVAIGKSVSYPNRSVDLDLLDDPKRLAGWLREQVRARKEAKDAG
jgi:hypothetical protein